ncbi:carbonic anhydrase [Kribbella sp. NPDC051586]|uniref:carbonic anhydrase n=1 Tax=Kribbella sp. NPDC051586 TaxID=3364118 RepID=UPI00378B1A34
MNHPPRTPSCTPSRTPSRRQVLTTAATTLAAGALAGCAGSTSGPTAEAGTQVPNAAATTTLVADGKQAMERLMAGNARFVAAQEQDLDEGIARRVAVSKGQHPFATILGCVDSRVPIELVFDQGLGDLVVVRSAGGALDRSVTGSIEFGIAELHTPLLMVLGHQRCGALDATIKAVDAGRRTSAAGSLDYLVDTLAPAVRQVTGKPGDRLTNAVQANVTLTLTKLRQSPVISPLEKSGKLKLIAAYYELDTGRVVLL